MLIVESSIPISVQDRVFSLIVTASTSRFIENHTYFYNKAFLRGMYSLKWTLKLGSSTCNHRLSSKLESVFKHVPTDFRRFQERRSQQGVTRKGTLLGIVNEPNILSQYLGFHTFTI